MSDFQKDLDQAVPIHTYNVGDVVAGAVILSDPKMILVDLDGQFTGIITGNHMQSSTEDVGAVKAGDKIESIIIGNDPHSGLVHLSLRKASQAKLVEKLHSNLDTKEIITDDDFKWSYDLLTSQLNWLAKFANAFPFQPHVCLVVS